MEKSAETEKKEQYFGYNKVKWIIHLVYWTCKHILSHPAPFLLENQAFTKGFQWTCGGWGTVSSCLKSIPEYFHP